MKINDAIQEYLLEIEIRKYTPKTIRGCKTGLYLFSRFLEEETDVQEIEDLSLRHVKQFTMYMVNRHNKGTYINGQLKKIKSFIQYHFEEGNGGFNTKKCFKWVKEDKPVIMAFKPSDVHKMLNACRGNDFISVRDRTIITMFFETGIRNSELCDIKPADIHDDFIIINGKNHKQRVVPISPVLKKAMVKYESVKRDYFALRNFDDFYFLSFHGHPLTQSANEYILKKYGKDIEGIRVSPHTCRHFFAQQQVKMGTDLYTISRLLGHENISITQIYLNSLRDEDVIATTKNNSVLMNMK